MRVEEVGRQARISQNYTFELGNKDYDTDEEFWREQDRNEQLKHHDLFVHVYWKAFYNKSVIFTDNCGKTVRSLVEERQSEIDTIFDEKFSANAQTFSHAFKIVSCSIIIKFHKL